MCSNHRTGLNSVGMGRRRPSDQADALRLLPPALARLPLQRRPTAPHCLTTHLNSSGACKGRQQSSLGGLVPTSLAWGARSVGWHVGLLPSSSMLASTASNARRAAFARDPRRGTPAGPAASLGAGPSQRASAGEQWRWSGGRRGSGLPVGRRQQRRRRQAQCYGRVRRALGLQTGV